MNLATRSIARAGRRGRSLSVRVATRDSALGSQVRRALDLPSNTYPAYWAEVRNFGDILSPVLLRSALGIHPVHVEHGFRGKLLGAGSIAHRAKKGDLVWGSGLRHGRPMDGSGVTFSAVRGPRTRSLVRDADVPALYGDPAMLLPILYDPPPAARRYAVGLVPHYVDTDVMAIDDSSIVTIDIRDPDWKRTVQSIVACDVIVSSSLHGIIAAEAYKIPAVWVQPTDRILGGDFKFHDYYEGTGRDGELASWSLGLVKLVDKAAAPPGLDGTGLLVAARNLRQLLVRSAGGLLV
jgi:pyruvyltransferase